MTASTRAAREASDLGAALSDIPSHAQLNPSGAPRIVHCTLVNVGYSYLLPGSLWPDGRARLIVNPLEVLNVPGTLRTLRADDAHDAGAEPPTQDHRGDPSRPLGRPAVDHMEES